jgi:hypothetical protein
MNKNIKELTQDMNIKTSFLKRETIVSDIDFLNQDIIKMAPKNANYYFKESFIPFDIESIYASIVYLNSGEISK